MNRYKLVKDYILLFTKPFDMVVYKNNYKDKYKYISAKNWFVDYRCKDGIILTTEHKFEEKFIYPRAFSDVKIISKNNLK